VETLVAAATREDGSSPLSEQFRFQLHRPAGARHLLAYARSHLAGYAQVTDGAGALVVAPEDRRHGVGTALLAAIPHDVPVWAHGVVPAATAFAQADGIEVTRELLVLGRSLTEETLPPVALSDGFVVRTFERGRDEEELLRVNAAAFHAHPEQGGLTRTDLDERMSQDWFSSDGLLLVVPGDDPDAIAGFHWTKLHTDTTSDAAPDGEAADPRVGEVYVVAVDPAYQGQGLGTPVTLLGLHHLSDQGVAEAFLYVEGDNAPALAVYRRLGFVTRSVDRMYTRTEPQTVER
ncbi:MAG: mycothiol synthase, partial [Actinomycetota bacterium]|nr:mycothiol synthase [Actinomycetota bacterium]